MTRLKTGHFWTFWKGSTFICQSLESQVFFNTLTWIDRIYNYAALGPYEESCLFLVNQMRGISALPVMGAKESLSVDLAGIARLLQIVTCAQSAT